MECCLLQAARGFPAAPGVVGRAVKWTVEKVGVPACGVGFSSQPLDGPVDCPPADHGIGSDDAAVDHGLGVTQLVGVRHRCLGEPGFSSVRSAGRGVLGHGWLPGVLRAGVWDGSLRSAPGLSWVLASRRFGCGDTMVDGVTPRQELLRGRTLVGGRPPPGGGGRQPPGWCWPHDHRDGWGCDARSHGGRSFRIQAARLAAAIAQSARTSSPRPRRM